MKLNMLTSVLVAALTQHPNQYNEITGSRVVRSAQIAAQATAEQAPEQNKFEDIALKFASSHGHLEVLRNPQGEEFEQPECQVLHGLVEIECYPSRETPQLQ